MSYKLQKPYTEEDYDNFIVKYNHTKGLRIEETITDVFALEENEIILEGAPIINPNYESIKSEEEKKKRIEEIKSKLSELDLKTIRALREGGTRVDRKSYLEIYQEEINSLRKELQSL